MRPQSTAAWAAVLSVCLPISCAGSDPEPTPETRSFALAFTPWPHAATPAAVAFTYQEILANGDWIAHHLDRGVPWQEALDGTPYPAAVENELDGLVAATPVGTPVYLAITPLNGARDGLALNWGASGAQPLSPPWDTRGFADAEVADAFASYALDLIGRFQPACLNFAIEASELALHDASMFADFVTFENALLPQIRAQYPNLPLMLSVALKSPGSTDAQTLASSLPPAIAPIDWVGISVYPYVFFEHADKGDPANLPADWLTQALAWSAGKPIAITETGWIAEDLVIPSFSVNVPSDPAKQQAYLDALFAGCRATQARFCVWFTIADFDDLWNNTLGQDPLAQIWRDTGLYDGVQVARPALARWQSERAKPLQQ
ncbi:MAG: hypothetical protein R3F33_00325 [Planctomycetota bacterium]